MSTNQRSTSGGGGGEKTYFEQQREALIGEIAVSFELVLANVNKLNRQLEALNTVGAEFSSVEALWSTFETVMAKEPEETPVKSETEDEGAENEQQRVKNEEGR